MEERHIKRVEQRLTVSVEDQKGMALDMSRDGMKVYLSSLLKHRDVDIHLHWGDILLIVKGYICWIQKKFNIYREPEYLVGVYLYNPPAEYTRLVETLENTSN